MKLLTLSILDNSNSSKSVNVSLVRLYNKGMANNIDTIIVTTPLMTCCMAKVLATAQRGHSTLPMKYMAGPKKMERRVINLKSNALYPLDENISVMLMMSDELLVKIDRKFNGPGT